MKYEIKANAHYGDLIGEVSCDGHFGPFLNDLAVKAKVPPNYFPIAASIDRVESSVIKGYIYACDKNRYGSNIDKIKETGNKEGEIEVKKFDFSIDAKELIGLIKIFDVVVKNRNIADIKLTTTDP